MITLGFFGSGETPTESIEALLTDYVQGNGGTARCILPATEDHWNDGLQTVADLALEKGWPLEVITDESSAKTKAVKPYLQKATKQTKAEEVGLHVVNATVEHDGTMVVLWSEEDPEVYDVIEAADNAGATILDLCEGLKAIELAEGDDAGEGEAGGSGAADGDAHTEESLAALTDAQVEALADQHGIDPEQFDSWDDVRTAILEQIQGTYAAGSAEDTTAEELPTAEEIEEWEFDDLKKFAIENEIDVPPKSRTLGYKTAIKEFLEAAAANTAALAEDEQEFELPPDPDGDLDLPPDPDAVDVTERFDTVDSKLDRINQMVGTLGMHIDRLTEAVGKLSTNGSKPATPPADERPPSTGVKKGVPAKVAANKAAAPAKKAPAKAAPAPAKATTAKKVGGASPRVVGRR